MARVIAVTGKGGVGKTTTAALMIRYLKQHASGPILAIDADPDANLAKVLGVPVEQSLGGLREDTLNEIRNLPAGMDKATFLEAGLHQIIVETEKVDFLAMGRPEGPGCYCFVNNLLRKFSDELLPSYEWAVMDSEPGMEHLSRRTASKVDHLVVVLNRSPLAIDCARRINEVIDSVKNEVHKKHFVICGVDDDAVESVRERANELEMEYLGHIPRDRELEDAIFDGAAVYDLGDTPAVLSMNQVMQRLGV